jgi:hypothetical protein
MAIELVPLCTMRLQGKPAVEVGTGPAGTRLIVDCPSVQAVGKGTINEDLSVDYEWYEVR